MAKRFRTDNPFFRFMGNLGDLALLNLLWLVCSLPVLTLGASTTALFYVARKIASGEDYALGRDFFRSFRANWRQATCLGLSFLAAGAVCMTDLWIGLHTGSGLGGAYRGVGLALGLVLLAVAGFSFPMLARYDYRLGRLLLDAARLAVTKPLITLAHLVLTLWLPVLLWLDPNGFLFCFPLWLLCGGAVSALAVSALLLPVQRTLEAKREEASDA